MISQKHPRYLRCQAHQCSLHMGNRNENFKFGNLFSSLFIFFFNFLAVLIILNAHHSQNKNRKRYKQITVGRNSWDISSAPDSFRQSSSRIDRGTMNRVRLMGPFWLSKRPQKQQLREKKIIIRIEVEGRTMLKFRRSIFNDDCLKVLFPDNPPSVRWNQVRDNIQVLSLLSQSKRFLKP